MTITAAATPRLHPDDDVEVMVEVEGTFADLEILRASANNDGACPTTPRNTADPSPSHAMLGSYFTLATGAGCAASK